MQILKILGIGALLLFPFLSIAQKAFYTVYSSGNFDIGEGVCQLPDSSYLVTGSSGGFNTVSAQAFVMKVSKTGDQVWTVDKGGQESETGRRIFYLDDTIYLFGRTNSYGNSFDYYFLKLDTLGATIEEKTFGSAEYDWLQDVVFIPKDSSFVMYGYQLENNGFHKKRQLIKINRAGDIVWQSEHAMHLEARLKNMRVINDTVFAVTGSEYNPQRAHFDGLLKLYLYDGTLLDSVTYSDSLERDYCFNDVSFSFDRYFLPGNTEEKVGTEIISDYKIWRYLVSTQEMEYSSTGFQNPDYNTTLQYVVPKKNNPTEAFVIERAVKSSFPDYGDGKWDEQIMVFYHQYNMFWTNTIVNVSKEGEDITNQFIQTLDGGAIAVGYKERYANEAQNVFLLKIGPDNETVPSSAVPGEESLLKVTENDLSGLTIYPNPVSDQLNIQSEFINTVEIYTLDGKEKIRTAEKSIDVSYLESGVYLLKATSSSGNKIVKFIKK